VQCRRAQRLFANARERTDFRSLQDSYANDEAGCGFCALEGSGRVLLENELALCISDGYPMTQGHSLLIPRRDVADGLALHQRESNAVKKLTHPIFHKRTSTC
jgi:hypothetical protein